MSVEVRLANEDVVNEIPSDRRPVQTAQQRFDPWQGPLWTLSLTLEVLEMSQPLVLAAWLCGVAILLAWLGLGLVANHHRVWRTEPAPKTLVAETRALVDAFRLRRVPAVRVHPGPIEPYLCGILRPVIVLPALWLKSADPSTVTAILAHELEHVKRRDLLANLFQRLVDTALFFHPSVRWLSRSLRTERERSTDALTVRITGDPYSLASALESVARFRLNSDRRFASFVTSLGGEPPSLLPRIQELLGMMPNHRFARRSLWPWASLPVAGLFALLGASLGLAQEPVDGALRSRPLSINEIEVFARSSGVAKVPLRSESISKDATATKLSMRPLSRPQGSDRQINYEVQFLSIADTGWRDTIAKSMREVYRDDDTKAWIVDEQGMKDLLVSLQVDPVSNFLQAPKVTAFEGAYATFYNPEKHVYTADVEKVEGPGSLAFRHIYRSFDTGYKIDVTGQIRGKLVLLDVDVQDRWLVTMLTRERRGTVKGEPPAAQEATVRAQFQSSVLTSKRYKGVNSIPTGSTLLVSLGCQEVPGRIPPRMNKAIGVVRAVVGGPPVEARPTICERLIAITPWAIRLEPENGAASPATSKDKSPAKSEAPMKPIQIQGTLNGQIVPFPSLPTPLHP